MREEVLCEGEVGLITTSSPDEELALPLIGSDAMHPEEIDDVLRLYPVGLPPIYLAEHLLVIEVAGLCESGPFIFQLHRGGGTSSCE